MELLNAIQDGPAKTATLKPAKMIVQATENVLMEPAIVTKAGLVLLVTTNPVKMNALVMVSV